MNILKFSAQWCMPCKMMKPIFKEVSKDEKYKNIDFIEIDIEDENLIKKFNITPNGLCTKYSIRNIPTLIIVDDDLNEVGKMVGGADKNKITNFIDTTLNQKGE